MDSSRGLHLPYDQSSLLSRRAYLFCYEQPRPLFECVKSHSLGCKALQPLCSSLVGFAIDSRRRCNAWPSFASLVWSLALTISSYPKLDWSPSSNQPPAIIYPLKGIELSFLQHIRHSFQPCYSLSPMTGKGHKH